MNLTAKEERVLSNLSQDQKLLIESLVYELENSDQFEYIKYNKRTQTIMVKGKFAKTPIILGVL